jgi:hypothetical protein
VLCVVKWHLKKKINSLKLTKTLIEMHCNVFLYLFNIYTKYVFDVIDVSIDNSQFKV